MKRRRHSILTLAVFISACPSPPQKENRPVPSPADATALPQETKPHTPTVSRDIAETASTASVAEQEILPAEEDGVRTLDFAEKDLVHVLTASTVKANPMAILMMKDPPFSEPDKIIALMKHNVALFSYLPEKLRKDKNIREAAISLGVQQGLVMTKNYHARTLPTETATLAYDRATAPNGYIVEGRPPQKLKKGDLLMALQTKTIGGEKWYLIKRENKSTEAEDQKTWDDSANVGGIKREDFSQSVDSAWIPATVTEKAITADQYVSGLYTYDGTQNGDTAVYVGFIDGPQFDGFGPEYDFLFGEEKGLVASGDRVRVIWKKPAKSEESPQLVWNPLPAAEFGD